MSSVIDPTNSRKAMDALIEIVRKDPIRTECKKCKKWYIRTLISASVCPYCGTIH